MRTLGLSCLLLQVASLGVPGQAPGGEDPGGPVATLCSPLGVCYSLHSEARAHSGAEAACAPQGRLTPMKNEEEKRHILALLEEGGPGLARAWIGLSKPPAQCVVEGRPLRGFQWAPGDEASEVDLWAASPQPTCTSAKCVALQRAEGGADWHWKELSCTKRYSYICRHDHPGLCSSLDLHHGQLVYQRPFLGPRGPVLSPPGTEATAVCHSAPRRVAVTCLWQVGGYRWVTPEGLHPVCPCPAGSGHCAHADGCPGAPCGKRGCHSTPGGFTCLEGAPTGTTGGLSALDGATAEIGSRVAPGGTEEARVPGGDQGATPRPRAEPGPSAPGGPLTPAEGGPGSSAEGGPEPSAEGVPLTPGPGLSAEGGSWPSAEGVPLTPGPGPSAEGVPLTPGPGPSAEGVPLTPGPGPSAEGGASGSSSFAHVLVPAILAAVTLGILALFLVALYTMCCRRRGGRSREKVPTPGGTDPEGQHMSSEDHPEENGL